jgi:ATP cone domain
MARCLDRCRREITVTPMVPAWVTKRDGRREPFDADKISQSLYAATEAIGAANAFLARELADGVLHFLGQENAADTVATAQIAELVEKVVRELGQRELAQAYAQQLGADVEPSRPAKTVRDQGSFSFSVRNSPDEVVAECLRSYTLQAVFGRDLAAAHADELLVFSGLETPDLLEAVVIDPPRLEISDSPWMVGWSQVRAANRQATTLVVDNPELLMAAYGPAWLEGFAAGLESHDLTAFLNLRPATPPPWASELAMGPLFTNRSFPPTDSVGNIAKILEAAAKSNLFRIRWHLHGEDFEDPARRRELEPILARVADLRKISFALDRPRQPLRLAHGIDRAHPATLMHVALELRKFLRLPEVVGDTNKMLAKLPSLVRMAASAGVQKRNYLRRQCPEMGRGFLLDRARLVLEPIDVIEVVREVTGAALVQSPIAVNVACQILQTLGDAAQRESRGTGLELIVVDSYGVSLTDYGLAHADPATQEKDAGALLDFVADGCFSVIGPQAQFSPSTSWSFLSRAWKTGHIAQVHLVPFPFVPET